MRRFMNAKFFEEQRREMVAAIRAIAEHIAAELGKTALDERVLRAMAKVPRHEFVPVEVQSYAYLNRPIPIGFDKTISQPMMVAVMTDLLELKPDDVVLEIGTGLGYQAAVLAELASRVYSVEIIDELAQWARQRLNSVSNLLARSLEAADGPQTNCQGEDPLPAPTKDATRWTYSRKPIPGISDRRRSARCVIFMIKETN
jgi:protein-L-isoaspartate(D-aspartate) O-methyltransferase